MANSRGMSGFVIEYSNGILEFQISQQMRSAVAGYSWLTYRPNAGTTPITENGQTVGYDGKGLISGTPTKAGVYHVTAANYNRTERASSF